MSIYFLADTHLGHKNILSYDNRPFRTIAEHDIAIMENWNHTVKADDEVYLIGDVSWHNTKETVNIVSSLNGLKHLIIGNHDRKLLKIQSFRDLFVEISDYKELRLEDGRKVILSHYPIPCFNGHFFGTYHLYGHVHTSFEWNMMERVKYEMEELYNKPCQMFNVGVMIPYMRYSPKTLDEILLGAKQIVI